MNTLPKRNWERESSVSAVIELCVNKGKLLTTD